MNFLYNKNYKPVTKKKEIKISSDSYVVKKGDTLYSISKNLKISITDLININNISGNNLSIGQVLKLK